MLLRVLVAAMFASLVFVPNTDAAMCIRLSSEPQRPVVARAAVIEIRTFVPALDGSLKPWIVRSYPFRVEAVSPRASALRVKVRPGRDPYAWRGTFRFNSVGRWVIRVTNFGPRYTAGCGEQLVVRVRAR